MEAQDLRIGNWINHNKLGKIYIDGISSHCNDFKIDNIFEWVYLKNCEPIPLTEEWLLKMPKQLAYPKWIKYLHELQNWYYWNNEKKELEINL